MSFSINAKNQMMNKEIENFYADVSHLHNTKKHRGADETLKAAATEFESMFLHMMLKTMRNASDAYSDDLFSGQYTKDYQDLLDGQMAKNLAATSKLGLSQQIYAQMKKYLPKNEQAAVDSKEIKLENMLKRNPNLINKSNSLVKVLEHTEIIPSKTKVITQKPIANVKTDKQLFATPLDFVKHIKPMVEKHAARIGICSDMIIAQAALESGWGQNLPTQQDTNSHNLFGIKANSAWHGSLVNIVTTEYADGTASKVKDNFRQYQNFEQSIADYVSLLEGNPRYKKALEEGKKDTLSFPKHLQAAGYATDPDYAAKVSSIYLKIKEH